MRVCVVTSKECWPEEDGAWRSFGGFPLQMAAVRSLFDEMTLLAVRGRRRSGGIPLPADTRVIPLRRPSGSGWRRKVSVALALPYYVAIVARHARRADVVHVPLPGDIPLVALVTALVVGRRVLGRYGSSWSVTSRTTVMNRLTKWLMRLAARRRHVMLATGAAEGEPAPGMNWLFATAIGSDELRTVRPDLDRSPARPLRLVYAGRLSSEKGVEALIDSLEPLRAELGSLEDKVALTIVGDGVRREWMERRVRELGCSDAVRFVGLQDREGLLKEMLQSDVCVLPSLTESFCKARLDAMLCGVPVLTTDVGFGADIVGSRVERGWIVPSGDPRAIAAAVARIVREPLDWPSLRARCRSYVERFTLEEWARRIGEICAARWNVSLVNGRLCTR